MGALLYFFLNVPATPEVYTYWPTLSLRGALPISQEPIVGRADFAPPHDELRHETLGGLQPLVLAVRECPVAGEAVENRDIRARARSERSDLILHEIGRAHV